MRLHWFALVLLVAAVGGGGPSARAAAKEKDLAPVVPNYDPPDQPFRMAPMPQSTRSIVVPLATNLHLAFDTALLRTHTVWSGKGLALLGPQYGLPKSPFISTNDGTVLWTMPPVFPWSVGKLPEKDELTCPKEAARFKISGSGTGVSIDYNLPGFGTVNETIGPATNLTHGVLRIVSVGRAKEDVWFLAHAERGHVEMVSKSPSIAIIDRDSDVLLVRLFENREVELQTIEKQVDYEVESVTETGTEKGNLKRRITGTEARVYVRVKPSTTGMAVFWLGTEVLPSKAAAFAELSAHPEKYKRPGPVNLGTPVWPIQTSNLVKLTSSPALRPSQVSNASFHSEEIGRAHV